MFFLVFLLELCAVRVASAQISADKTIINWEASAAPVFNITVRNSAKQSMLVAVQVFEVMDPGTPKEARVPTTELIVAPKRLTVPGKGDRTVRLLLRKQRSDMERVFRVSFVPQESDEEIEQTKIQQGGKQIALKVLTGVGTLIFIHPLERRESFVSERVGAEFHLHNRGNINILLDKIKSCEAGGSSCSDVAPKRLYPGNDYKIAARPGTYLTLRKRSFEGTADLTIK